MANVTDCRDEVNEFRLTAKAVAILIAARNWDASCRTVGSQLLQEPTRWAITWSPIRLAMAVKAHRVVRRRSSHSFSRQSAHRWR
jgi:hypothetical protein